MSQKYTAVIIIFLEIFKLYFAKTTELPLYNVLNSRHKYIITYPHLNASKSCLMNSEFVECSYKDDKDSKSFNNNDAKATGLRKIHRIARKSLLPNRQPSFHRLLTARSSDALNLTQRAFEQNINMRYPVYKAANSNLPEMSKFNMPLYPFLEPLYRQNSGFLKPFKTISSSAHYTPIITSTLMKKVTGPTWSYQFKSSYENFSRSLDNFGQKLYMVTFTKLTSISPQERQTNGVSFVQSGFFLHLTLMALSLEVDPLIKDEIDKTIGLQASNMDTMNIIKEFMASLPVSSANLKFRYATQLMLWPGQEISAHFRNNFASALQMSIDMFNGTETSTEIMTVLNQKVVSLSGGAIRNTFDEEDVSDGVTAVLMNIIYFRAQWRSAPTLLNGTKPFHDSYNDLQRTVKMIKLNDIMGYANIKEWNAQALEIPYSSSDLSLLIMVPYEPTLKRLAEEVTNLSITNITSRMRRIRIAATIPLYTLRMTLLLPNKLQAMGVTRLFDVSNMKPGDQLRLSHMVQRVMFWSETGRNAYKDDGLEWDETPEMEILVDRPYIFYVRWRNLTLLNGNFVL